MVTFIEHAHHSIQFFRTLLPINILSKAINDTNTTISHCINEIKIKINFYHQ